LFVGTHWPHRPWPESAGPSGFRRRDR
jgi:hypothetical protein